MGCGERRMLRLLWTRSSFVLGTDAKAATDYALEEARVRGHLAVGLALAVSPGGMGRPG